MNTYRLELVIENYYITAENETIAEEQYARFHSGMTCYYHENAKLAEQECGCVEVEEELYHNTELIGRS